MSNYPTKKKNHIFFTNSTAQYFIKNHFLNRVRQIIEVDYEQFISAKIIEYSDEDPSSMQHLETFINHLFLIHYNNETYADIAITNHVGINVGFIISILRINLQVVLHQDL